MPVNKLNSNAIEVTFVDYRTQEVLGSSVESRETLPEKIAKQATLNIEGTQWSVMSVTPAQPDDIAHAQRLTVALTKIEAMNPQEILFSLPTLASKLPYMDAESEFEDFVYEMYEDNWRQQEFLPLSILSEIKIELQAVTNIWENHREDVGTSPFIFNHLHVRTKTDAPHISIRFDELLTLLEADEIGALKLMGQEDGEYVEDGFAIATPVGVFYGIVFDDMVEMLCVAPQNMEQYQDSALPPRQARQALSHLAQKIADACNLIYVNWCSCYTIPAVKLLS